MAHYKVSTSPCGCKSLVKEEVKEIVTEVTTCDCCTRDWQANVLTLFPPGQQVTILFNNGESRVVIVDSLVGTLLVGTNQQGQREVASLCDVSDIREGGL
ncbi:hypothetical protein V1503_02970 [Bacillus sp. SCS-151]|uniref:hypothetical protein n=1 Tax=Nanhaiella sioensis TaxID=3115293 RepID=UPI003979B496